MALILSNATIAADAAQGTVIGTFSAPAKLQSANTPAQWFLVSGTQLLVSWAGQAISGNYSISVLADQTVPFTIVIMPAGWTATTGPAPLSIGINGSAGPVSVSAGAAISVAVANGPGNPGDWLGVYTVGSPTGSSNPPSWKWLATDTNATTLPTKGVTAGTVHLAVPAQTGKYEVRFFTNNSFAVAAASAAITVSTSSLPPTPQIAVTPASPSIPDATPRGAVVGSYVVTMSDGSPFGGTVAFGAPNFDAGGIFALHVTAPGSGQIIVNPAGPGVGPNQATITDHVTLVATS